MSKLVFILGAGCSVAAGAPTMPKFLDVAESFGRSKKLLEGDQQKFDLVFKAYDCLQSIYSKSSEIDLLNIEPLFAAFEMAEATGVLRGLAEPHSASKLVPAITRTIVRMIELSVRFPGKGAPIPYDRFCKWCKSRAEDISILTFNYDLCLDWALHLGGLRPDYRLPNDSPEDRGPIDLLKLHGSLNWAFCEQCGIVVKRLDALTQFELGRVLQPAGPDDFRLAITGAISNQTCSKCSRSFHEQPVIVPPTWNKGGFSSASMKTVWARAAEHLAEAEYIIIIGYSVPPTDQFFHYLYALGTMSQTRLKKILVYNPDESIEGRYRRLLGPTVISRFKFISGREDITGAELGKFENAIQRFSRDLGNW
jgi:NAD-dependent SIR2 family protein deacetylase